MDFVKSKNPVPHILYKKRFWGFPRGVSKEPAFTAMASNITSLVISFFIVCLRARVIGTTINSVMSFVKNIERKTLNVIKKNARDFSVCRKLRNFTAVHSKKFDIFIAVVRSKRTLKALIVPQFIYEFMFEISLKSFIKKTINSSKKEKKRNSFFIRFIFLLF
jgi:hypothetical protein